MIEHQVTIEERNVPVFMGDHNPISLYQIVRYVVSDVGDLRLHSFRSGYSLACPHVPPLDGRVFSHRVDLVLSIVLQQFEGSHSARVSFQIVALLDLPQIPHLHQAIVSTRDYFRLVVGKADHSHAGLVLSHNGRLVLGEVLIEVCHSDLQNISKGGVQ